MLFRSGILMLALMGLFIDGDLHEHNALKAWLGLLVNLLAGVLFWHKGLLDLRAGVAVGAGALCGGYVAARVAQLGQCAPSRSAFWSSATGMPWSSAPKSPNNGASNGASCAASVTTRP